MNVKRRIKAILERPLATSIERRLKSTATAIGSPGRPPVLVASVGRVGSKIVWEAVSRGLSQSVFSLKNPFGRHIVRGSAWDLSRGPLLGGLVYKTHDLPYLLSPRAGARVVFLFGRPSDVVLSVAQCNDRFGASWVADHLSHMRANGQYEEMFTRDVLRLSEHVDAWRTTANASVLGMRYEAVWKNVGLLSDFVRFPVVLPPFRPRRRPNLPPELITVVRSSYADLDRKFAELPDYFHSGTG